MGNLWAFNVVWLFLELEYKTTTLNQKRSNKKLFNLGLYSMKRLNLDIDLSTNKKFFNSSIWYGNQKNIWGLRARMVHWDKKYLSLYEIRHGIIELKILEAAIRSVSKLNHNELEAIPWLFCSNTWIYQTKSQDANNKTSR